MNIMIAEYAVGAGETGTILLEGRAMLDVLVKSFEAAGYGVVYPTSGPVLSAGTPVLTDDFDSTVDSLSKHCDAALIVAPDELLGYLTELIEKNTVNLGCPSGSVRLCADKLMCTKALNDAKINVPRTGTSADMDMFSNGEMVVVKPRWGCASENTFLITYDKDKRIPEGFVATEYIEGDHMSVSLVVGETTLPLTVNRQNIKLDSRIQYDGGTVGIETARNPEMFEVACRSAEKLGCRGYIGVDIVMEEEAWVIDVNPRPTTSIIGIDRLMDAKLGELIIKARFGRLPGSVHISEEYAFTKADLV